MLKKLLIIYKISSKMDNLFFWMKRYCCTDGHYVQKNNCTGNPGLL